MPGEPGSPESGDELVVGDLETLRVISDPLRMRMIDLMSRGEWTVKQLAASLGVGQTRLYHHMALLESRGLIRVTGTRLVSGITEKRYTAPSTRISVDPRLFLGGAETPADVARAVDELVASAFATVRREIERSIEAGKINLSSSPKGAGGIMVTLDAARLTASRADELRSRVEELLREFAEADVPEDPDREDPDHGERGQDVDDYGFLVAFYRAARRFSDGASEAPEPDPDPER